MGFAQVTLARELTFDEVRDIAADGIRTEVFIHGALCYSYSGLCLMSSHRSGRSGNRGRCSYPCREQYRLAGSGAEGLAFSMKDLALGTDVRELAAAGVHGLKIEGRMKGALYVAAVTDFYRRLLDGDLTREADIRAAADDLQTVFSRPWTKLYAHAARRCDVVDPDRTGNRGLPVGTVQTVTRDEQGTRWLQFRTERALELHDGLQFDLPGLDRPYGFGIERFGGERSGKPVFQRPAGATVLVELPPDGPQIPNGATVCCTSSQAVKQRYPVSLPPAGERKPRRLVDVRVSVAPGEISADARTVDGHAVSSASVQGNYTPAKDPVRMRATVEEAFAKLGETEFALQTLDVANPEGLFVPMSHLNNLRRDLCERLSAARAAALAQRVAAARAVAVEAAAPQGDPVAAAPAERWIVRTDDYACLAEIDDADEVVLELSTTSDAQLAEALSRFGTERLRLALPVIARAWEIEPLAARIDDLAARGHRRWLVTNLAAWPMLARAHAVHSVSPALLSAVPSILPRLLSAEADVVVDWTLPSLNPQAVAAWLECGAQGVTLSPEDACANLAALLCAWGAVASVVLYQDTPLMISEACPKNALEGGCGACASERGGEDPEPLDLEPVRGGDGVRAVLRDCRATLFGGRPFSLAERLGELRAAGGRLWRVDFALRRYTPGAAAEIWRTVRSGRAVRGSHAGNWARGV
jgi:putative protease